MCGALFAEANAQAAEAAVNLVVDNTSISAEQNALNIPSIQAELLLRSLWFANIARAAARRVDEVDLNLEN